MLKSRGPRRIHCFVQHSSFSIISMRTLAVDLGSRRVGLALSDEGGRFATPYDVLTVGSAAEAITHVRALIAREGVKRVVIGLPLNMDDSLGPAAKAAVRWGAQLQERCEV